jgi:hypothetical protein
VLDRAVEKAKNKAQKENKSYQLLKKGIYTPAACVLVRVLVNAGCSQALIRHVYIYACTFAILIQLALSQGCTCGNT